MKEKVFSTDKFLSALKQTLDDIAGGFETDMISDAKIVATRLMTPACRNDNAISHMQEIGMLAEMLSNCSHDCRVLFEEFNDRFSEINKEQANALDAMAIITDIGRNNPAPHVEWLFESSDMTLQNIFNDSFITAE